MPEPSILGIDAGGSALKWAWREAGEVKLTGRLGPLTVYLLTMPEGLAVLEQLRAALPGKPDQIVMGLAGLGERHHQIQQQLAQALHLPAGHIRLMNDLELAYRAHLSPGQGILIYAGTGSIAYHLAADGRAFRAGGRGYKLGDEGGGFSLGRAALRWISEALDLGQPRSGPLAEALAQVIGGLDWDSLRAYAYGSPGGTALAALVPAIAQAAERGDTTAQELFAWAAGELLKLGEAVRTQLGRSLPLWATGGVLHSTVLHRELLKRSPDLRIVHQDHAVAATGLL